MAVGTIGNWKIKLGYFFTASLTAEVQSQLVLTAIEKLDTINIRAIALIVDGLRANQTLAKILGGSLKPDDIISSFPHPKKPHLQIYMFFDTCHLIKLVRTAFHDLGKIVLPRQGEAQWAHVEELHNTQQTKGLCAANKLTNAHVHYKHQKMIVKLATQVLSRSVALGITFMRQLNIAAFADSVGIEFFISLFDEPFDTFNSRSACGRGTKALINSANLYDKIHFLLNAEGYLLSMTTATGERSFCFVGFIFSINSLINLTLELFGPNHEQTHVFINLQIISGSFRTIVFINTFLYEME